MGRMLLSCAGIATAAIAVFQAALSFSPAWATYWGAPPSLVANPVVLLTSSLAVAALFGLMAWYAFSGAGVCRRLPWCRPVLWTVGVIFALRGLLGVPAILVAWGLIASKVQVPSTAVSSSLVALAIGVIYLVGLWQVRAADTHR